jgi:ferredoxin
MKVDVDMELCASHGQCTLVAPEVFALDDDAVLRYDPEPDDALRPDVEQAVQLCPAGAIRLLDP